VGGKGGSEWGRHFVAIGLSSHATPLAGMAPHLYHHSSLPAACERAAAAWCGRRLSRHTNPRNRISDCLRVARTHAASASAAPAKPEGADGALLQLSGASSGRFRAHHCLLFLLNVQLCSITVISCVAFLPAPAAVGLPTRGLMNVSHPLLVHAGCRTLTALRPLRGCQSCST